MRWRIKGASQDSGIDIDTTIDAQNEEAAMAWAVKSKVLIESVAEVPDNVQTSDLYPDIVTGVQWLKVYAIILLCGGVISGFVGLCVMILGLAKGPVDKSLDGALLLILSIVVVFISVAVRMVGALAIAIRDIAVKIKQAKLQ